MMSRSMQKSMDREMVLLSLRGVKQSLNNFQRFVDDVRKYKETYRRDDWINGVVHNYVIWRTNEKRRNTD